MNARVEIEEFHPLSEPKPIDGISARLKNEADALRVDVRSPRAGAPEETCYFLADCPLLCAS